MAEKEYIEREAAIDDISSRLNLTDLGGNPVDLKTIRAYAKELISHVPAADVRSVVMAYWKSVPHKRARVCSRCEADEPYKFADDDANVYNFCPNCGAYMREGS